MGTTTTSFKHVLQCGKPVIIHLSLAPNSSANHKASQIHFKPTLVLCKSTTDEHRRTQNSNQTRKSSKHIYRLSVCVRYLKYLSWQHFRVKFHTIFIFLLLYLLRIIIIHVSKET